MGNHFLPLCITWIDSLYPNALDLLLNKTKTNFLKNQFFHQKFNKYAVQ